MNKTALTLLYILIHFTLGAQNTVDHEGALVRSDTSANKIFLCFTGHDFDDGFDYVLGVLDKHNITGSFFLTGDFVRSHRSLVKTIADNGHYIGAHSDKHLLYCDWTNRESLNHSPQEIKQDIADNLKVLKEFNIFPNYFMPPFEWYNEKVVKIALELGQTTVSYSPGTRSNADYSTPDMPNYITSEDILKSIHTYEKSNGMNGFHLLIHPGVSPNRKDKLYCHLDELLSTFKQNNYHFSRF